jgi:hypothetical protein
MAPLTQAVPPPRFWSFLACLVVILTGLSTTPVAMACGCGACSQTAAVLVPDPNVYTTCTLPSGGLCGVRKAYCQQVFGQCKDCVTESFWCCVGNECCWLTTKDSSWCNALLFEPAWTKPDKSNSMIVVPDGAFAASLGR